MAGNNPLIIQGSLNRIITHVVVPLMPYLNVSASYMAKSMSVVTFEDQFNDQIGTATNVVNSPMPYVMTQVVIGLLRSQTLSSLWLAQTQTNALLGPVTIYSDSTQFPEIDLDNCSIMSVDPGPYDGTDPTTKITLKGVYYANSSLWIGATS